MKTLSVKYYPIVANAILLMLMVVQYINLDFRGIFAWITGMGLWPLYNHLIQSKQMRFCLWHRVLLYNIGFYAVISLSIWFKIEFNHYFYLALTINILTLIIATVLYFKDGCFQTNKKSILRSWERHGLRSLGSTERQRARGFNKGLCGFSLYLHSNSKR